MTQTRNRPGVASGAASEKVGVTELSLPPALHGQVEWEGAWQYAEGWAAGYAAGQLAIANEVAVAIGVPVADRRSVIRDLIRGIGQVTE